MAIINPNDFNDAIRLLRQGWELFEDGEEET